MQKKKFFKRPSSAQILKNTHNTEVKTDFWENIISLKKEESLTLVGKLFDYTSDEFLKRGPSVIIPTTIEIPNQNSKDSKLMPYEIREIVFNSLKEKEILHYNGFVFTPKFGPDKTRRRIRLNDVLEAAKLYSYAPISIEQKPFKSSIQINTYDSVDGVASIGARIIARIPSRMSGKGRYKLKMDHVPIIDNPQKFLIAYMLKTDHVCEDKKHELKFPTRKNPDFISEYRFDEHEIAAYFAVIDYYANPEFRKKEEESTIKRGSKAEFPVRNLVPLDMNLTGIPTTMLCTAYDNLLHRVLIKKTPESKPTTLEEGHLEALLWEGVIKEGYRKCFFKSGEGKIKDFAWTNYLK